MQESERSRIPDAPARQFAETIGIRHTDNGGWVVTLGVAGDVQQTLVATEPRHLVEILQNVEWVTCAEGQRRREAEQRRRFVDGMMAALPFGAQILGPLEGGPGPGPGG